MTNVTLCSAFRTATRYLHRYFEQMAALQALLTARGDSLHLVLGEGDHTDATRELLPTLTTGFDAVSAAASFPLTRAATDIVSFDHGGPDHGSVVNPVRFANMAKIWNRIWARIAQDADVVVFCEADLVWKPAMMVELIDNLKTVPAISPMIMLKRHGWPDDAFYDNWAFRRNGQHIGLTPPYFDGWDRQQPIQVEAGGSCLAMRGDLARLVTWPPEDVIVGICRQLYEQGASIWLHPGLEVTHL